MAKPGGPSRTTDNFEQYLAQFKVSKGVAHTHTRMNGQDTHAGSFHVPDEEWSNFMRTYYQLRLGNDIYDYFTEKQLTDTGPLLGDFDFHYEATVLGRQHKECHVMDMVDVYARELIQFFDIPSGTAVEVFVMERNSPYLAKDNKYMKDGLHMIFGVQVPRPIQLLLRTKVIPQLQEFWDDLPLINSMSDVVDRAVTTASANWQMYGSRKPGCAPYFVKYHFIVRYEEVNDELRAHLIKQDMRHFSAEAYMEKLSARYPNYPKFPVRQDKVAEVEKQQQNMTRRQTTTGASNAAGGATNALVIMGDAVPAHLYTHIHQRIDFSTITGPEVLDHLLQVTFQDLEPQLYRLRETHDFTMALPNTYYGPGSYTNWIRVGWALCNTSIAMRVPDTLFLTWLKLSSQDGCRATLCGANSNKFDWALGVPLMIEQWAKFRREGEMGLTHRSIMYWCKTDNRAAYDRIMAQTIDHFVDQVIITPVVTEFDIANILYHMHKDRFVCINVKAESWYQFINHRWVECQTANELRHSISKELRDLFDKRCKQLKPQCAEAEQVHGMAVGAPAPANEKADGSRELQNRTVELRGNCGRTTWKNNIMRESRELFYDREFVERLDTNQYLMCFTNGVVDIKNKVFRHGMPDDCVSLCTNIEYIPYEQVEDSPLLQEIETFMSQLFPEDELRKYMWQHMASLCVGNNVNQTFHLYKGTGRNGKSALVDLLSLALGDYKKQVPISWVTSKRASIGGATPELAQLPGVRYAVMQEPEKGAKIQEGVLKEITGGDPVQARALFQQSFTFKPQFKLVVCTNFDFEDMAGDDGTWRRIRMIDFKAKFMPNPYEDEKFPRSECQWQFKVDSKLAEEKFPRWAPVLMSKLIHLAFELQGKVEDCELVLASSAKYRERQDYFTQFVRDKIQKKDGEKLTKTVALAAFKQWYLENYTKQTLPKGREFYEFMERKFGVYSRCWKNITIQDESADGGEEAEEE